jgi:arabinofuranosyltransferase
MGAVGTINRRNVLKEEFRRLSRNPPMIAHVIVAAAAALTILCGVLFWRYTVDDAFITFRYANNLARGAGPVFNPGERVEGISNFSWMLVMALVDRVGGSMLVASKILGILAAVGMIVVLYRSLLRHGCRPGLAAIAPLWLVATPTLHMYSACGLETVTYAFVVLVATIVVSDGINNRREAVIATLCLIAMPTLRPDGIACSVILTIWLLAVHRRRLSFVVVGVAGFVLFVGLLARYSYYGQVLPNTFRAKPSPLLFALHAGLGSFLSVLLRETSQKVTPFLQSIGGPLLFALLGGAVAGRRDRLALPGMLVFLLGIIFVLYAPVDWMTGHRFGLPYVAPALFAAALGGDAVLDSFSGRSRGLAACGAALAVVPFLGLQLVDLSREVRAYNRGDVHKAMMGLGYVRMGKWLNEHANRDDVVAAYEIGALGYFGDRRIVDYVGLISPYVAKLTASAGGLRFGEDNAATPKLARFVASQSPRWFFANPSPAFDPATPEGSPIAAKDLLLADQRRILEELERCAGTKVVLAKVFPMGVEADDPSRYFALEVPKASGPGCPPPPGAPGAE